MALRTEPIDIKAFLNGTSSGCERHFMIAQEGRGPVKKMEPEIIRMGGPGILRDWTTDDKYMRNLSSS